MLDFRYMLLISALSPPPAKAEDGWEREWERREKIYEEAVRIASLHPTAKFEKAVKNNDLKTVTELLDSGVPVSLRFPISREEHSGIPPWTEPIHEAASKEHVDMVRLLLDRGAETNALDDSGNTPLHFADDIETAKLLIERGANVSARNDEGSEPIHYAAYSQSTAKPLALFRLLIEHGANPMAQYKDGTQPIHIAAANGTAETVGFFLNHGAKTNAQTFRNQDNDRDGWQPLHFLGSRRSGAEKEDFEIAKLLINRGADVNAMSEDGFTPLHSSKYASVTRILLEHGARIEAMENGICKHMPIHLFALHGDTESIRLLLDHGANPNARTGFSLDPQSPLDMAVFFNHPDTVELLMERGAKPTKRTTESRKRSGNPEMLRIIRKGTNTLRKGPPHRR